MASVRITTFMRVAPTCAVVLGAVVLGACASSGTTATPETDLETARLAVLDYRDVPAGFVGTAYDTSRELPPAARVAFGLCLGAPATLFDSTPGTTTAYSQDFARRDTRLSNRVAIHRQRAEVDAGWAALDEPKTESCLETRLRAASTSEAGGATVVVGTVVVQRRTIERIGDRATAFRTTMQLQRPDGSVADFATDTLLASKGRASVTLTASNVGAPVDPALTTQMLRTVVERLRGV